MLCLNNPPHDAMDCAAGKQSWFIWTNISVLVFYQGVSEIMVNYCILAIVTHFS